LGLKGFDGILFDGFCFGESLAIVKVDKVSGSIVLSSLSTFGAVPGEVSYFSALEASVRLVSRGGRIALEIVLRAVPLIAIGVLPSAEVVASVVSSVVPSRWCPVPIYIHGDRGVVHPTRGIRRVILWGVLSLRALVVPLRAWLLRGESPKVLVSSEYVSE